MTVPTVSLKFATWEKKYVIDTQSKEGLGTKEKGVSPLRVRQRCQGDQSLGSESLTVGPAEINEVWGLSRAGSPGNNTSQTESILQPGDTKVGLWERDRNRRRATKL